jgi:hypothetical protein
MYTKPANKGRFIYICISEQAGDSSIPRGSSIFEQHDNTEPLMVAKSNWKTRFKKNCPQFSALLGESASKFPEVFIKA